MVNKIKLPRRKWLKLSLVFTIVSSTLLFACCAFAGATPDTGDIGTVASTIVKSFESLGNLMIAISYLAGIGFTIASIFKFKQHRDNPTQIPMGTPIALLGVGIILIFLPAIVSPAGKTIFGREAAVGELAGGYSGKGGDLPGPKSTTTPTP